MNNSALRIEDILEDDSGREEHLQVQEAERVRILEALKELKESSAWQELNQLLFTGLEENLEAQLRSEATKSELNAPKIYRLQGQLMWARGYSDLEKLEKRYSLELQNIRKQIKNG